MKAVLLHFYLGMFAEKNMDLLLQLAKLENKFLKKRISSVEIDRPVYITGLARSGTSILLDILAQSQDFASYCYADFPFPMLPFWWHLFRSAHSKKHHYVERSHKDGLKVTPESPEAMEEILWNHFFSCSHDPKCDNRILADSSHPFFEELYSKTISKLLLARKAKRYLAKNNYNIARIDYLCSVFSSARFVVTVRDPVWHISSLMKQHSLLSEEEMEDKRLLAYMRHSKHFEFGLDRRPLNLGNDEDVSEIQRLWDAGYELEGWSKYWAAVYRYLADLLVSNDNARSSSVVIDYDQLCTESAATLDRIYAHVGLSVEPEVVQNQVDSLHAPNYYEPDFSKDEMDTISRETSDVYQRIKALS